MTDVEYQQALFCWFKALAIYLLNKAYYQEKSFLELARAQAKMDHVPFEHLDKVSEWFDWDQICKDIRP